MTRRPQAAPGFDLAEPRRAWWAGVTARAETQHGLVSRRQVLDSGCSVRTLERLVARGLLVAVRRGVYVVGWSVHRHRSAWDHDHDKANAYVEAGWRVLFLTSNTAPGDVVRQLRRLISENAANRWRSSRE